jgi:hypothetical protein
VAGELVTWTPSLERDLERLQAFLDHQRPALLDEARKRRDGATEAERNEVEQSLLDPSEVERRLDEGLQVLMGRMDEETAAAMARLGGALAMIASPERRADQLTPDLLR